jgi:hypothetical protein
MKTRNLIGRLALASALVAGALGLGAESSASASGPPFTDPAQTGLITLCNQQGQVVKSGSTLSVPFAWYAVSSSPAPTGYGKGTAQLAVYQAIQHEDPSNWDGGYLSVGSWYTDPDHPIAAATNRDTPLVYFVQDHPLYWDGLVELRMFYSALGKEFHSSTYPIAIVKVDGNNWKLVEGGSGPCDAGTAKTLESQVTPVAQLDTPQTVVLGVPKGKPKGKGTSTTNPGSQSSGSSAGSSSTTTRPSGAAGSGTRGPAGSGASGSSGTGSGGKVASGVDSGAASLSDHKSSDGGAIAAAIAAVVVALLAGTGLYSRRRLRSRQA